MRAEVSSCRFALPHTEDPDTGGRCQGLYSPDGVLGVWGAGPHPVALTTPQCSPRSVVGGNLWVLLMPNRPKANIVSDQRGAPAAAHLGAWQYAHRRAGIQVGPDLQPGVNPGTLSFFHERRDRSGSLGSCTLFGIDVRRGNPYDRGNNPYDRADRDRP
jgi:hypothetical protein